jgi:hypothetical protein
MNAGVQLLGRARCTILSSNGMVRVATPLSAMADEVDQ